jgi:hypothetical protein
MIRGVEVWVDSGQYQKYIDLTRPLRMFSVQYWMRRFNTKGPPKRKKKERIQDARRQADEEGKHCM